MPQLTVSIYTYNSYKNIQESIESLLENNEQDFEIMVVDDGSTDNTAEIVNSIENPRVKLIRNSTKRGIPYCHNAVIKSTDSRFITLLGANDTIFPGALSKIVNEFKSDKKIGQINSYFIPITTKTSYSRDIYRDLKSKIEKNKTKTVYKTDIVLGVFENNGLSTYRKEVFKNLGLFNENLVYGYEYEMALRICNKYHIVIFPEILYTKQVAQNNPVVTVINQYGLLLKRLKITDKLIKSGVIKFSKDEYSNTYLHFLYNLIVSYYKRARKRLNRLNKRKISRIIKKHNDLLLERLYRYTVDKISFNNLPENTSHAKESKVKTKIGYVIWHFPVLSQTFIQREITALISKGIDIEVFADDSEDIQLLNKEAKSLMNITNYVNPIDKAIVDKFKKQFFYDNPIRYLYIYLFVVFTKYTNYKHYELDKYTFSKAVYLAGKMQERSINHIHSPWANNFAFISLIASRLLDIPYTVQARAYDIHKNNNIFGLKQILDNAEFIITNCLYNKSYLQSMVSPSKSPKIYTIYNGVKLSKFRNYNVRKHDEKQFSILTVGRITEQKGFIYLLEACNILNKKGYKINCNIIGATTELNYYIKLKVLHKKLGLGNYVSFEGARSFQYIMGKYKDADLVVLPCIISESNGTKDIIPNVLIEAMAMKIPVVSTNITGIPELVENSKEGILVPPRDSESLANAIIGLMNDRERRIEMGENGRRKVKSMFNIDNNIQSYLNLFNS